MVAFAADGRTAGVAVNHPAGPAFEVVLWDARAGAPASRPLAHAGPVTAVAVADDGRVLTASGDGTLSVWDSDTGRVRDTVRGHPGGARGLALDRAGSQLFTAGGREAKSWPVPAADRSPPRRDSR